MHIRPPLLFVLIVALAACGFQLRGDVNMPPVMARTYVANADSALQQSIARALALSGVEAARSPQGASALLRILSAPVSTRVVAKDEFGRAREYEVLVGLHYTVTDVQGNALMEPQQVQRRATLLLDPTDPLGNRGDIDYYVRSMRDESVWEMLRRIAATEMRPPVSSETEAAEADKAADIE